MPYLNTDTVGQGGRVARSLPRLPFANAVRISQNQGYCDTRHDAADTAQASATKKSRAQGREVIPTKTLRC